VPRGSMIGAAVHDPQRHFGTDNCRIAKGSFVYTTNSLSDADPKHMRRRRRGPLRQFAALRRVARPVPTATQRFLDLH
jgi:hypothetical protein